MKNAQLELTINPDSKHTYGALALKCLYCLTLRSKVFIFFINNAEAQKSRLRSPNKNYLILFISFNFTVKLHLTVTLFSVIIKTHF